jgi:hypothetical protein
MTEGVKTKTPPVFYVREDNRLLFLISLSPLAGRGKIIDCGFPIKSGMTNNKRKGGSKTRPYEKLETSYQKL